MHRNVTAVYRSHATADLVRRELENLGISRGYIHVIPDDGGTASGTRTTTGTSGAAAPTGTMSAAAPETGTATPGTRSGVVRDDDGLMDAIDDLNLPDADAQTYKHCVAQGDYIVSAEVDDDQVGRVQEIMRRPEAEAHNLDTREAEFRDAGPVPRREGRPETDATRRGQRDESYADPYTRAYRRDERLEERRYD